MQMNRYAKNIEAWEIWKTAWLAKARENQNRLILILVCSFFAINWLLTIAFPIPPEIAALNLQIQMLGGH